MEHTEFYKTTIVIYTDYDPANMEISQLAREAECGDAICTGNNTRTVQRRSVPEEAIEFLTESAL